MWLFTATQLEMASSAHQRSICLMICFLSFSFIHSCFLSFSFAAQLNETRVRLVDMPSEVDAAMFFVHGFGGQLEQFAQMFPFYAGRCRLVAFDQPGHGLSDKPVGTQPPTAHNSGCLLIFFLFVCLFVCLFVVGGGGVVILSRTGAQHYTPEQLVENVLEVFRRYRRRENVLVAHSYGTSLLTFLCARLVAEQLDSAVSGLVLVAPTLAGPRNNVPWWVPWLPCWALDAFRYWEQRGGTESTSVLRFVHPNALPAVKQKQLEWNRATPSHVVLSLIASL